MEHETHSDAETNDDSLEEDSDAGTNGDESLEEDSDVDTNGDDPLEEAIPNIPLPEAQQVAHQLFDGKPVNQSAQPNTQKSTLGDIVLLEADDIDDIEKAWGFSLVGYFAGRFPGKAAVARLRDSWNVKYEYQMHPSGWLVFKFENESDRNSVLISGPHSMYGRHLLLKPLPYCFGFDAQDFKSMPVWITLPGLPLECWNEKALDKILSHVGSPLFISNSTLTRRRISHARALVEVDYSKDLIKSITIRFPTGKTINQKVVYEYQYEYCSSCEVIGHSANDCFTKNA